MENVKLYSIYFLTGQLAALILVGVVPVKKRYQKIISLATTLASYPWSLYLFFFCHKSEGIWGTCLFSPKNSTILHNFEYFIDYHSFLFTTFTILFLVIISVEFGTMPSKNEELGELVLDDRVERGVSERLSKIVTLLFLGAQFCLSNATFWFYFM